MEYTVNGLARLAGVSVRTLHWYDEIGLLRPARVTEAGYRMYGPDEVDALQSILFYRALGVPLKQIGALRTPPPDGWPLCRAIAPRCSAGARRWTPCWPRWTKPF